MKVDKERKGKYSVDGTSPIPNRHQLYLRLYDRAISLVGVAVFSRAGVDAGRTGR